MDKNKLSDEEYFKLMMSSVKPLKQKVEKYVPTPEEVKLNVLNTPIHHKDEKLKNNVRTKSVIIYKHALKPAQLKQNYEVYSNQHSHIISSEETMSYFQQPLSKNHLKKLQQGELLIQAKLDLHGLQIENARIILCDFITKHARLGYKCVLIIHGKGGIYNEIPILKNHVHDWLQQ